MIEPRVSGGAGQQNIRVLAVDDDPNVRFGIEIFIEVYDDLKIVGMAANGEEALQACAQEHPQVVLMDAKMPVMDGITATRIIKGQYPDIQIIVLSAYIDREQTAQALEAGAFRTMHKSVSTDELADSIRAASRAPVVH